MSFPFSTLNNPAEASTFFAANNVSSENSFRPIIVRSSITIATFGKCLNKESFTSEKSTFALMLLLISFFMLTTSLAKPVAMNLSMPIHDEHSIDIEQSKVLNIICDKNNTVWYYEGNEVTHLKKSNYTFDGIRKAILNKQKLVDAQWKKDENGFTKTICLIKMTDDAIYNNMVDVLDEMDITNTKIYAIIQQKNKKLHLIL